MACFSLGLLTVTAILLGISTAEQQHGAPVKIENITAEYGPWEKQSDRTLKFLRRAEVIIVSEGTNVDITWKMRKWGSGSSEPQFESQLELSRTDGEMNFYKATLQIEYPVSLVKTLGVYEVTIKANGGYFNLKQDVYGQLYQHLSSGNKITNNKLEVRSFPPKHVLLQEGMDVDLYVDVSAHGTQDFHAARTKYVTKDGNVTIKYTNLSPSMFEMERVPEHITLVSYRQNISIQSTGMQMHYTTHRINIKSTSSKDIGRYVLTIHCGLQTVTVFVDLVSTDNPPSLLTEPGIMLTSCSNEDAFTKGFMGVTMGTSNCINCRVFGMPEANIYLQKDGLPLISSLGHILDGGQDLINGASLIYNFNSVSEKDKGHYECRAVSAVNSNLVLHRSFEVAEYIKVTTNKESESVGETQVNITCKAHGYPLPEIDFYYYDPSLADAPADLALPGDNFQIHHEQIDDQTVIDTLLAPVTVEGHFKTNYYCVGRNIFT